MTPLLDTPSLGDYRVPSGEASERRIRTTLQAAATGGADGRRALRRGTLDKDVEPAGFGDPTAVAADPPELRAALAPLRRAAALDSAGPTAAYDAGPRPVAVDRAAERRRAELHEAARRARALAADKRDRADLLAAAAHVAEEEAHKAHSAAQAAEEAAANT